MADRPVPEAGGPVVRAAGALVWRPAEAGELLALVHRPRYDDWSFPKGKCHPGEHVLAAAVREVAEETGVRAVLGRPLTASFYPVGGRYKRVSYWAARCAGSGQFTPDRAPDRAPGYAPDRAPDRAPGYAPDRAPDRAPGQEVDEVAWLPPYQARRRLSYERDVALLDELASGPVATAPFIVLRHASAGSKTPDALADAARSLDAAGTTAAATLAGLLACYGPCRVISSPAERCLATVRPYAAALGLEVTADPAFAVTPAAAAGPADPRLLSQAAGRAATLACDGVPTLICAHRENLPGMIDAALGALRGGRPGHGAGFWRPGHDDLAKGAFVVLQTVGGALASAERHDIAG